MPRVAAPGWQVLAPLLVLVWFCALATGVGANEKPPICNWKFEHHATVDRPVTCSCGPPSDMLLNLDPLNEELGIEGPKYEGSVLHQVGGVVGSYTYTPGSSVCLSAQHAGVIEEVASVGGIVTFLATDGCQTYEGSTQNGIYSQNGNATNWGFYFPSLSNGGCPGEAGYGNRYAGGPALDVLLGMLSVALPKESVRYASAESQGIEAFTVERLFLRPPEKPPIAIGKLTVERVDMEYAILKIPPRYLTVSLEGVSMPSSYLGPLLEAAFEGKRLSFDASLDYRFNLDRGNLDLIGARLSLVDEADITLRARLGGITSGAVYGKEQQSVQLHWLRLRIDDETLLARLLPRWWNRGEAMTPQTLRETLMPVLEEAATTADLRTQALLAAVTAVLRDLESPAGEIQFYVQPPSPLSFEEIGRLLSDEPQAIAEALRSALLYPGDPADLGFEPTIELRPAKAVFAEGENLVFDYRGAVGEGSWIAVHYVGSPPRSSEGDYHNLDGVAEGRADFGWTTLSPGFYEAVLWVGEEYQQQVGAFTWFAVE